MASYGDTAARLACCARVRCVAVLAASPESRPLYPSPLFTMLFLRASRLPPHRRKFHPAHWAVCMRALILAISLLSMVGWTLHFTAHPEQRPARQLHLVGNGRVLMLRGPLDTAHALSARRRRSVLRSHICNMSAGKYAPNAVPPIAPESAYAPPRIIKPYQGRHMVLESRPCRVAKPVSCFGTIRRGRQIFITYISKSINP